MFTGIITDIGRVASIITKPRVTFLIETNLLSDFTLGSSICCSGVCLTVIDYGIKWFKVEVSEETLQCTIFQNLHEGDLVNLEKSLKIGDELGGNFVTGHVDTTTKVLGIKPIAGSHIFTFELPKQIAEMLVPKGSITINGVALTVNTVTEQDFSVCIIPHSFLHTNFKILQPGSVVNLEVDMLARYITKMIRKYNE